MANVPIGAFHLSQINISIIKHVPVHLATILLHEMHEKSSLDDHQQQRPSDKSAFHPLSIKPYHQLVEVSKLTSPRIISVKETVSCSGIFILITCLTSSSSNFFVSSAGSETEFFIFIRMHAIILRRRILFCLKITAAFFPGLQEYRKHNKHDHLLLIVQHIFCSGDQTHPAGELDDTIALRMPWHRRHGQFQFVCQAC